MFKDGGNEIKNIFPWEIIAKVALNVILAPELKNI